MIDWNLSDRINFSEDVGKGHNYYEDDVKEFIKRLKIDMDLTLKNAQIINKLAGEKLI